LSAIESASFGGMTPSIVRLPHGRMLSLAPTPLVMGVINVTPDSFSDGGIHDDPSLAVESALRMVEDGAAIIDVGGESTRPGAEPVDQATELRRVVPVIASIRARSEVVISVDTMKSAVAREAIDAGADLVNDVTALRHDEKMTGVIIDTGAAAILMHMRGEPRTMQHSIRYDDLLGEIGSELAQWHNEAIERGLPRDRLMIDPGLGFGKRFEHNLQILAAVDRFTAIAPVVVGASRKGFIGHLTGREAGTERAPGSLAAVAMAAIGGAAVVRVHDVRETSDFLEVFRAIRNAAR
jgi:dihydropteroate synthase